MWLGYESYIVHALWRKNGYAGTLSSGAALPWEKLFGFGAFSLYLLGNISFFARPYLAQQSKVHELFVKNNDGVKVHSEFHIEVTGTIADLSESSRGLQAKLHSFSRRSSASDKFLKAAQQLKEAKRPTVVIKRGSDAGSGSRGRENQKSVEGASTSKPSSLALSMFGAERGSSVTFRRDSQLEQVQTIEARGGPEAADGLDGDDDFAGTETPSAEKAERIAPVSGVAPGPTVAAKARDSMFSLRGIRSASPEAASAIELKGGSRL